MKNLYDVNFNIYTSITVEADSREEAEEMFCNFTKEEISEAISDSIDDGGVDLGTIELLAGKEPEDEEDEEEEAEEDEE